MTWGSYAIVTGIVFLFLLFIAIIGESSSNNGTTTYRRKSKTYRRRNYNYSSRETDYYDSDMEGAPGYNGFDKNGSLAFSEWVIIVALCYTD